MPIQLTITLQKDQKCKLVHFESTPGRSTDAVYSDENLKHLNGIGGNYCLNIEPTEALISAAAARVYELYGPVTKYYTWYADAIKQYRLIFGN